MTFETYTAYVLAVSVLLMMPGPSSVLVLSYTLSEGRRAITAIVGGVITGDVLAVTVSLAGIGALVAASPVLFGFLKWFGVIFLLYLAYRNFRPAKSEAEVHIDGPGVAWRTLFLRGMIITSINPESLGFFFDFLPEFVDNDQPVLPQLLLLGGTYIGLAAVGRLVYALAAEGARELLSSKKARQCMQWFAGGVMIAAAIWSAFALQHGAS